VPHEQQLLTRCGDAREAARLRQLLTEGGIACPPEDDVRRIVVARAQLGEARALLAAFEAMQTAHAVIDHGDHSGSLLGDDARLERRAHRRDVLLAEARRTRGGAYLVGRPARVPAARLRPRRRRRLALALSIVPGFGAGHLVAGRYTFAAILAVTEIVGVFNLMLAHTLMGALMIAVAIAVDAVGAQLALRRQSS